MTIGINAAIRLEAERAMLAYEDAIAEMKLAAKAPKEESKRQHKVAAEMYLNRADEHMTAVHDLHSRRNQQ